MQNQQKEDLYTILGIAKDASHDDIKKTYRKLAMEYHPDKNNGDKTREEMFKKINQAYCVLSDTDKRKQYDQFGVVDGNDAMGGASVDLNDLIRNMFGGIGGHGGGVPAGNNGFSFMFMDGSAHPSHSFGNPFQNMRSQPDFVDIKVDICDIYYGNNKRVEFELLDLCDKCNGTGAQDPTQIVACLTCNGQGHITQQLGPFFVQKSTCPSCMGKCNIIKNNKLCLGCKGEKTCYNKKIFELRIPKGIPNNHEIRMEKKGSYDPSSKKNKDMIFRFQYKVEHPYHIDENTNVVYTLDITIEELLAGFKKNVKMYRDNVTIASDRYFNPLQHMILKEKGVFNIKRQKHSDFVIVFNVIFTESERLSKYNEVLQKVLKKQSKDESDENNSSTFNVQDFL